MKKLLVIISVIFTFMCSFSNAHLSNKNDTRIELAAHENLECENIDTVTKIITKHNNQILREDLGVIIANNSNEYYIATSLEIYDSNNIYYASLSSLEIKKLSLLGVSKENKIAIFKFISDRPYCTTNIKDDDKMQIGRMTTTYYLDPILNSIKTERKNIVYVGACRNCNQDTFKNYFYSKINLVKVDSYYGSAIFSEEGNLLGIISDRIETERHTYEIVDSNKLLEILSKLLRYGEYKLNYLKHNLINVSELDVDDKNYFNIRDNINAGVLVSSVNYLNYFTFNLNIGMIILKVEDKDIYNKYDLDYELSKYEKGSYVRLKVLSIVGLYRSIVVKI